MTPDPTYEDLTFALLRDPDLDVSLRPDGLYVGSLRFAYRHGGSIAVLLPTSRADDLVTRSIGTPLPVTPIRPDGRWVAITDPDDWNELAAEAHTFARGTLPGRQS